MKKIFFTLALLLQLSVAFGQNAKWGSWTPVSCFSRLSTSVLGNGYVPSIKEYSWQIRIKSSYAKKVTFNMTWIVGGERLSIGQVTLAPGESYGHTPRYFKSSSNNISVEVSEVCFEGQDCYKNGYADCNGNQVLRTTSNSTTNNSSTATNQQTQQNNPTFDRNNVSYQDYYKRATAAGQAGNYDEAISLWNSAILVAVNDTQKSNAQAWLAEVQKAKTNAKTQANNAEVQRQQQLLKQQQRQQYNNTVNQANSNLQSGNYNEAIKSYGEALKTATTKSEKNIAATGAIASGAAGIFDILAKAKEEKRERERLEQVQRERERIEQERIEQQATNLMEANWQNALDLAKQDEYSQAIKIMIPYLNANKINAYSTGLIGFWYYKIDDYKSAKICYEKALKLDKKTCAMHYLGTMYEQGKGVEMNYETALSYYKQSCDNGDETGCKNYAQLKPIVDEARKVEEERAEKAKGTISSFDFKPYLDYLVSQLEAQGFMFDNVYYFCTKELSKSLSINFVKNNQKLTTALQIDYDKGINLKMYYKVDDNLREDFSRLQLTALIGDQKISNTLPTATFNLVNQTPKSVSADVFKNSKYAGFEQETTIKNEETLKVYEHNYGLYFCGENNTEKIKWLQKIVDAGGDIKYHIRLEELYLAVGDEKKALETFSSYVSKNANDLNSLSNEVWASLKSKVNRYTFNKLITLADAGNARAAYYVAGFYDEGVIRGESQRTGSGSVTVPYITIGKNWEKAIKYYAIAHEGNNSKGYVACRISKLYDEGGNGIEKNTQLHKEWKKKAKETGYKCK